MANDSLHFNSPGSTFSKINANGNPSAINPPPTQITSQIDTTSGINKSISQTESAADQKNAEYRSIREKEMVDPSTQANSEINNNIKNPKPVNFENATDTDIRTEFGSLEPQPRSPNTDIIETKTSRNSSDTEQGLIERTAMSKINTWMSDAGSNSQETKSEEPKDPDTSTQKSKKTGVGMVPALDRNREKTSIPDSNKRPQPSNPNIGSGPAPTKPVGPKLKVPKISMPKMKLR
jgi:hypothetical protein